jgi:hypothetical protein
MKDSAWSTWKANVEPCKCAGWKKWGNWINDGKLVEEVEHALT